MFSTSAESIISPVDISDAYKYHAMLVNGPGRDSDSDTSDDDNDSDDSDDSDELDFSSDGNEDEPENGDPEDEDPEDEDPEPDIVEDGAITEMRLHLFTDWGNDREKLPMFPVFILNPKTELTLSASGSFGAGEQCSNSKSRNEMWLGAPNSALRDLAKKGLGFLDQIGQLCIQAKIRECENERCKDTKERMRKIAPTCSWEPFREWALTAMSCQACLTGKQKLTMAHTHIASAVYGLCTILKRSKSKAEKYIRRCLDGPSLGDVLQQDLIDIAPVCNVLSWMMLIQDEIVTHPDDLDGLGRKFSPPTWTLPVIEKATNDLQDLGICKNRLWNLVTLSERQENDLPDFMDALNREPDSFQRSHGDHKLCTPTKCQQSQIDSTTVGQMHKCEQPLECRARTFNVDLLETSLDLGKPTSWSRLKPCLIRSNESYIAISHVWSDGTGVGVKNAGCVNECLFDFFADIAKRLDSTGIWWDALSIPQDSKARSKALNKMHLNYANARATVVHDNYLVNFEWRDDGSPCLALVLSSWFTRGWTALELIMSGEVRVLFKDPDGGPPLMKNLDTEVLASEPGGHTRAHWLISGFIRRLRQPIDDLGDLLAILKARSTSWARDRTIIAALLLNVPDCDFTRPEGEITRQVLSHLGYIPFECLFHGKVTMADSGPWSWCVTSLDDVHLDLSKKLRGIDKDSLMLVIDKRGTVTGRWGYRKLEREEIHRLEPYGENLAVRVKVRTALRHWKNCLLLREWDDRIGPVLLVTTVGVTKGGILECRYVGRVLKKKQGEQKPGTPSEEGTNDNEDSNIEREGEEEQGGLPGTLDEPANKTEGMNPAVGNEHLHGDVGAMLTLPEDGPVPPPSDNDDNDKDSLSSSKVSSDSDDDISEGSEADDVDIDDDMGYVFWDEDNIRIGNDVTKDKPAKNKPARPAKQVLRTLNKILMADTPEDENADDDVNENADEQDSDLESLRQDKSSDESSDSDDESARDGIEGDKSKGTGNSTAMDTPWFSQADVYRRSQLDLTFEYDQYTLEPDEERVRHLYAAINANNKEATRHLIKSNTDLPEEVKKNLIGLLYQKENTFKKLKTLGDVYFETGKVKEAKEILVLIADTMYKDPKTRASTERLESLQMLGRILMKEKDWDGARKKFGEVLDLCDRKNKKKDEKIAEKAKLAAEKSASKEPLSQPGRASTVAKQPTSRLKRAPTINTSSKTNRDPNGKTLSKDNPTSKHDKPSEPKPDQKVTKWFKIELNAHADLCLLEAETGDFPAATARYQKALKSFGKSSTSVDVFKNIWGTEEEELDADTRNGQYMEAEVTYLSVLKRLEGERQVGKEHRLTLINVLNLAIVYELRKKYQEAELLYKRARAGITKELGEDHVLALASVHRLAAVSTTLEKLDGTDKLYQLALDGVERKYEPSHVSIFIIISDFGNHYLAKNESRKAIRMFQRIINGNGLPHHPFPELSLAALSDKGRCYAQQGTFLLAQDAFESALRGLRGMAGQTLAACSTAFSLGMLYEEEGDLPKAASNFEYCMVQYGNLLGKNDTETLKATRRLGLVQAAQGDIQPAQVQLQRAYDGYIEIEKIKASDKVKESQEFVFTHPDTLETAKDLGSVCISLGNLDKAEKMCSFAYTGLSKGLGPDDISTLMASRSMGILCFKQLKLALSMKYLEETLAGLDRKDPKEVDPDLIFGVATDLGVTYTRIGKYEQAERLLKRAIAGFTKIANPKIKPKSEVPLFIAELRLGDLYAEQELFDLARKSMRGAHKGLGRILGPGDTKTLEAVLSLGKLETQPFPEAEKLLKETLSGLSQVAGPDDMRTLDASASLGYLYMKDPVNFGKAVKFIKQAIDGYERLPVSNHPYMLEAMYRLGVVYKKQGDAGSEEMFKKAITGFELSFGSDHAVAFRTIMRLRFPTERVAEVVAPVPPSTRPPLAPTPKAHNVTVTHCAPPPPSLTPDLYTSGPYASGPTLTGRSLPIHSSSKRHGSSLLSESASKESRKLPSKGRQGGDPLPTPLASPEYISPRRGGIQSRDNRSESYEYSRDMAGSSTPQAGARETKYRDQRPSSSSRSNDYRAEISTSYGNIPPTPMSIPRSPATSHKSDVRSRELPHWDRSTRTCSTCGNRFLSRKDFDSHASDCPGDYFASVSKQTKNSRYDTRYDNKSPVPEPQILCPICQAVVWSQDELAHHAIEKHPLEFSQQNSGHGSMSSDTQCMICGDSFSSRNQLFKHLKEQGHDEEGRADLRCKVCGDYFESRNELFKHLRDQGHEVGDALRCRMCGDSFQSKTTLFFHLREMGHEMDEDEQQQQQPQQECKQQ